MHLDALGVTHCSDTGMIGEGCEVVGEGGVAVCSRMVARKQKKVLPASNLTQLPCFLGP